MNGSSIVVQSDLAFSKPVNIFLGCNANIKFNSLDYTYNFSFRMHPDQKMEHSYCKMEECFN
jgi:hypothetical protein